MSKIDADMLARAFRRLKDEADAEKASQGEMWDAATKVLTHLTERVDQLEAEVEKLRRIDLLEEMAADHEAALIQMGKAPFECLEVQVVEKAEPQLEPVKVESEIEPVQVVEPTPEPEPEPQLPRQRCEVSMAIDSYIEAERKRHER